MSNMLRSVTNFTITAKSTSTELTWTDPDDIVVDGITTVFWKCTKILRKTSGYPKNIADGTLVVSSTIRNQYQSKPFVDSGLERGTTYYYSAFTLDSYPNNISFNHIPSYDSAVITPTRIMTININFDESDPTKMCSYADDAVGAPSGYNDEATAFWKEFFGYRPCLFKDGSVVGYLNPSDYSKFEDGTSADITSGNAGDVMIEYPRRGVNFSKSGNIVTISVTDDEDNAEYTYYAHTKGTESRGMFYIGAYLASVVNSKLRSISGRNNTNNQSPNSYHTYIQNLGEKYSLMTFYQVLYVQIMYCFQFANNLNSQSTLGYGVCSGTSGSQPCGSANTKGLVFGTPGTTGNLKLFGLENPWGVGYQLIDGFCTNGGNILTATNNFNVTGSGYSNRGTIPVGSGSYDFITKVVGTSELGFVASSLSGSESTYLCDKEYFLSSGYLPIVWGDYSSTSGHIGIFLFYCGIAATDAYDWFTTRIAY